MNYDDGVSTTSVSEIVYRDDHGKKDVSFCLVNAWNSTAVFATFILFSFYKISDKEHEFC